MILPWLTSKLDSLQPFYLIIEASVSEYEKHNCLQLILCKYVESILRLTPLLADIERTVT